MSSANIQKITVALAGNPNVGKSTLFNVLTGLHQHTGNWPGKTVEVAKGFAQVGSRLYEFIDLPGTYTLNGVSEDERVASGFLTSGAADCIVAVCDGSSLERSLILALQILQCHTPVVLCVNLMDEARKNGIHVDETLLSDAIGVPVVLTAAGRKHGIDDLLQQIAEAVETETICDRTFEDPVREAEKIAEKCVAKKASKERLFQNKVDTLLVSRRIGIPVSLLLLLLIIWLTVWGANHPSEMLGLFLEKVRILLKRIFSFLPLWLSGLLFDGMYATAARVISVMLPPMAIFFPLFTILEDMGYLPRVAFLLDGCLRKCGGCGKQSLTMLMGLGCNAVGVMGCRIIDSPREKTQAILTNSLIPCNGRFPTLILLGSLFFTDAGAAFMVAGCVLLGIIGAMVCTGALSKTVLRHEQSVFLMDMPPFRTPRIGQILVRSLLDRTAHISMRALKVAAPTGALLWILGNTGVLTLCASWLDPFGKLMGMNGVILLAFLFSFPANELFVPVALMAVTGAADLQGVAGASVELFLSVGITWKVAVCTMLFTLFHWPCATTLMTIYSETGSKKETAAAFLLPTAVGMLLCMMVNLMLSGL